MPGGPSLATELSAAFAQAVFATAVFFALTVLFIGTVLAWWFSYFEDRVRRCFERATSHLAIGPDITPIRKI
jgi:ABC-type Fe3+ transport system permease subunit